MAFGVQLIARRNDRHRHIGPLMEAAHHPDQMVSDACRRPGSMKMSIGGDFHDRDIVIGLPGEPLIPSTAEEPPAGSLDLPELFSAS
jgi:hypothetical protein